jgi:hypothetical protein
MIISGTGRAFPLSSPLHTGRSIVHIATSQGHTDVLEYCESHFRFEFSSGTTVALEAVALYTCITLWQRKTFTSEHEQILVVPHELSAIWIDLAE